MENVKNDAICHITRQNQYNPAGGGATTNVFLFFIELRNLLPLKMFTYTS